MEKKYEQVGNIRIKEEKKKNKKKKKSDTPLAVKAFVWFMFIAMALSTFGPLVYLLISAISES